MRSFTETGEFMAQDAGSQGVEPHGNGGQRREKRRAAWPFILLAAAVVVVAMLLWLSFQRPVLSGLAVKTQVDELVVDVPPVPAVPDVPASSGFATDTETGAAVPNVVGDPESRARRALEGAGFTVSSTTVFDSSRTPGLVVAQNPAGGTQLDEGASVHIAVAAGTKPIVYVTMPEVVNLSQSRAESKIKAAGLRPYVMYGKASAATPGPVISQWPLPGSSIPKGSEGFIQVALPDLTN